MALRGQVLLLAAVLSLFASAQPTVIVGGLSCEHLIDPLGIASLTPRLGWRISAAAGARNVTQQAYQLLVASTAAVLSADRGDVFDSGKVASAESNNVWGGPHLTSGQMYYWKVRVWTSAGASNYSASARFSVGLQNLSDWSPSAHYIAMGSAASIESPWFRTSVTLSEEDAAAIAVGNASALLHVASVGYHEAYVNGHQLEDASVLLPSTSFLAKRIRSHTFDAAPFLAAGENVVGLWLGPGWGMFLSVNPKADVYNLTGRKVPAAMAELRIQPPAVAPASNADEKETGEPSAALAALNPISIVTDGSWKCSRSSYAHIGQWTNSDFGGDRLDHFSDNPAWATPGFDASGWENASTYDYFYDRIVSPEVIEPTQVVYVIPAVSIAGCGASSPAPGCIVITLGELFTGWIQFDSLTAPPNTTVLIQYATNASNTEEFNQRDQVVLTGAAEGEGFVNKFAYHEMQYVTVTGLSAVPVLTSIRGLKLMTARERVGSFASSNQLANDMYGAFVRTYEGLSTGGNTVDCPHRERLGYGGEAHGLFR